RLAINGVVLEISAPRTPCYKLGVRMGDNTFVKQFVKAGRPGAYARVIQEGVVAAGDTVTVNRTSGPHASVKEVFALWHRKDKSLADIRKVLQSPIGEIHRRQLQGWVELAANSPD